MTLDKLGTTQYTKLASGEYYDVLVSGYYLIEVAVAPSADKIIEVRNQTLNYQIPIRASWTCPRGILIWCERGDQLLCSEAERATIVFVGIKKPVFISGLG